MFIIPLIKVNIIKTARAIKNIYFLIQHKYHTIYSIMIFYKKLKMTL